MDGNDLKVLRERALAEFVRLGGAFSDCVRAFGVEAKNNPYVMRAQESAKWASECEIQIDDVAVLSETEHGCWVSGQFFVPNEDLSPNDVKRARPWVVYHPEQPDGERYWSNEDGWTCLSGAARYSKKPYHAKMCLGGPEMTSADALEIGTMLEFVVQVEEPGGKPFLFDCFAESFEHAVEQAKSAYPAARVLAVIQGNLSDVDF